MYRLSLSTETYEIESESKHIRLPEIFISVRSHETQMLFMAVQKLSQL